MLRNLVSRLDPLGEALCLWKVLSAQSISFGVAKKRKKNVLKQMLGNDIRSVRKDKDMTLEQVSDRSGLHPTTIQKIESGEREPRAKTLMKLAKGLDVLPGELLKGDAWSRIKADKSNE